MTRRLDGSLIQSGTITSTQLSPAVANSISAGGGPRVTSLIYPGNDTAGNTVGGQTVYIVGSGFETNNAIYINGNAVPSKTFISASNISFTTPALSTGIYPVYVINTDTGAIAIFVPGYVASAEPNWVTSAGSLNSSQEEIGVWSYSLSATGDEPITYALAAGSSLPSGISLAANGLISGTLSSPSGNATTYTFSVVATDAQNQDSTRQFSVTTTANEGVLFANNVLLIHADSTNNKNNHTFLDSSNNNHTITRFGNATQGTFSPYGNNWSNYFDGTGDFLTVPDNDAWDFGTGDFTVETWIHPTTSGVARVIGSAFSGGGNNGWSFELTSANLLTFYSQASYRVTSTGTIPAHVWTHVVVSRSGSSLKLFINGVTDGSVTDSTNISGSTATLTISGTPSGTVLFTGYQSNFRVVKGTAVYTSNFTSPILPLTAIANTQLLTCQSNRYIDNSTNAFTLTRNGDVSVQKFSPFALTDAYSAANNGGSVYLDGNGDYLSYPADSSFWNDSSFTMELWAYVTKASGLTTLVGTWTDGNFSSGSWSASVQSTNVFEFSNGGSSTTNQGPWMSGTTNVRNNAWNHFCVTKSAGNAYRLFTNGRFEAYRNESFSTNNSVPVKVGYQGDGTFDGTGRIYSGWISGFRIIRNGVPAEYQTSLTTTGAQIFTPPTTPPTNVANTTVLMNFTNAGIIDNTMMNVLETVGDAKVSTAQYKYGTGSIAFDGTGDNITIPSSPNLDFGTGDFTIELWANFSALSTNRILLDKWASGNANSWQLYWRASGTSITFLVGASTVLLQDPSTSRITTNTWYHIAVTRSGSTNRLFIDGVEVASATNSTNLTNTNRLCIGEQLTTLTNDFSGYIDDLRITKGYARYTSNFTPPTSALKDK